MKPVAQWRECVTCGAFTCVVVGGLAVCPLHVHEARRSIAREAARAEHAEWLQHVTRRNEL